MIQAIPNQPLNFTDTRLQGCLCGDPDECLLVDTTDELQVQFVYTPCLGEQQLASPDFDDASQWLGPAGWTINPGAACLSGSPPYSPLTELSFVPALGQTYLVRVNTGAISGPTTVSGLRFQFGGVIDEVLTQDFTASQWIVTTVSPQPVTFTSFTSGTGCISLVNVFLMTPDLTVELLEDGVPIGDFQYSFNTNFFDFEADRVTINFTPADFLDDPYDPIPTGCFVIRVTDGCDNTELESQCVRIDDYNDCTIAIRACNAGDAIGFVGDFTPTMRVYARLSRPKYEYEVAEERWSNGRINRYFADRRMTMELGIDRVGEFGHRFLSTLPLWDHVYVGQEAFVVRAEGYEPGYADVYDAYGSILLVVEPYEELTRKVRCGEDSGGCAPPPNYLVQGTGPNTDYVLQSPSQERIFIH